MMANTKGGVFQNTPRAGSARGFEGGFTLIELMVVVAVVAILAAIAYPSFQDAVRKSKRGQAKADMVEYAQLAERWHSVQNSYVGFELPEDVSPREDGAPQSRYNLTLDDVTANEFTINAEAVGDQEEDRCGDLSLNQAGEKTNSEGAAVRLLVACTTAQQKSRHLAAFFISGARSWTRTNDPLINSQVL